MPVVNRWTVLAATWMPMLALLCPLRQRQDKRARSFRNGGLQSAASTLPRDARRTPLFEIKTARMPAI